MIITHFFISQAHSQCSFCFLVSVILTGETWERQIAGMAN